MGWEGRRFVGEEIEKAKRSIRSSRMGTRPPRRPCRTIRMHYHSSFTRWPLTGLIFIPEFKWLAWYTVHIKYYRIPNYFVVFCLSKLIFAFLSAQRLIKSGMTARKDFHLWSTGFAQERSASRNLLPRLALARPADTSRAPIARGLQIPVRREGEGYLHQSISLSVRYRTIVFQRFDTIRFDSFENFWRDHQVLPLRDRHTHRARAARLLDFISNVNSTVHAFLSEITWKSF